MEEDLLVGRVSEIKTLQEALVSSDSEMIAVIGRRRVGKTFLIIDIESFLIAADVEHFEYL